MWETYLWIGLSGIGQEDDMFGLMELPALRIILGGELVNQIIKEMKTAA